MKKMIPRNDIPFLSKKLAQSRKTYLPCWSITTARSTGLQLFSRKNSRASQPASHHVGPHWQAEQAAVAGSSVSQERGKKWISDKTTQLKIMKSNGKIFESYFSHAWFLSIEWTTSDLTQVRNVCSSLLGNRDSNMRIRDHMDDILESKGFFRKHVAQEDDAVYRAVADTVCATQFYRTVLKRVYRWICKHFSGF